MNCSNGGGYPETQGGISQISPSGCVVHISLLISVRAKYGYNFVVHSILIPFLIVNKPFRSNVLYPLSVWPKSEDPIRP